MPAWRLAAPALWTLLLCVLPACSSAPRADPVLDGEFFFDDFNQANLDALRRDGWIVRERSGHPGIAQARWGDAGVDLADDPQSEGNRLLRLRASTGDAGAGPRHAQVCQQRKFLEGTYAARLRFADQPREGPRGDVVVQTFYAIAPLRFDFDPQYSEIDWEYLPNGGWGDVHTRLYAVSWQTARLDPWLAVNDATQAQRSVDGWHELVVQVSGGHTRWYLDGADFAQHGGRNYPVVPMSISFSIWFSPGGLLPDAGAARSYEERVDWVFHARNQVLAPAQVRERIAALRRAGVHRHDSVPAADPPLPSSCDL